MGKVAATSGRADVSTQMGALRIVIPARRNLFLLLFLLAWLGGWFMGETSAITHLLSGGARQGHDAFLGFWLIAWTIGGGFAITAWLWNLAGREIVTIGGSELVHRLAIGPIGFSRNYDLAQVKELRVAPIEFANASRNLVAMPSNGPIAFDYGAKTIRFGAGVDEAEAKQLVQTIVSRFHYLAPRP